MAQSDQFLRPSSAAPHLLSISLQQPIDDGQPRPKPVSPAHLLDDLSESAYRFREGKLIEREQASKSGHLANVRKAVRYTVSDFLDYRPSRSAAQAFLGTNQKRPGDSKHDPRPDRVIDATNNLARENARNDAAFLVSAAMMQLAKGLGDTDKVAGNKSRDEALTRLNGLIGEGQTKWLLERFERWAATVAPEAQAEMRRQNKSVDLLDQEDLVSVLAGEAARRDTTISNIKASLGLHDRPPSKAEMLLTGATLTPTIIGPTAMVAESALELANGGDRTKRLEEVLALGMALNERTNLLTRQSALAISSLDRAKLSDNSVLYAYSRDLIRKLQGKTY